MGDDLIPEEITKLLGAQPTDSHVKGQELSSASGTRVAEFGMWRLSVPDREPEDINAQVECLLAGLTYDLQVWSLLASKFELDLFCGLFMNETNEGASLSPATLLALGQRGIEMSLDIYAPVSDA